MTRVLLVDDETDMAWAVQQSLEAEGYQVLPAQDGLEALELARQHHPDLIILDIVMPGLDGLQLCRRFREDPALEQVPILFLTVRKAIEDRIRGLDHGADDYIIKPFDLGELSARVRALLRRTMPSRSESAEENRPYLEVGPLTLNGRNYQVQVRNRWVQLTATEFNLLHFLVSHPDEFFSSEQLLQQVWGYAKGTAELSLVRWHMKNIRGKLEADPSNPAIIRTVPRLGYIFPLTPSQTG